MQTAHELNRPPVTYHKFHIILRQFARGMPAIFESFGIPDNCYCSLESIIHSWIKRIWAHEYPGTISTLDSLKVFDAN